MNWGTGPGWLEGKFGGAPRRPAVWRGVPEHPWPSAELPALGFTIVISEFRKLLREPHKPLNYMQTVIKPTNYFYKVYSILSLEKKL